MVSESVSWPVSMMIGALKPFLRRMRTASRPSMSGRPTSMMTRSIWPALAACTPLLPFSTATASNSSCSDSCSVSASRSSVSSSTIRILRVFGINSEPRRRFAAPIVARSRTSAAIQEQAAVGNLGANVADRAKVSKASGLSSPVHSSGCPSARPGRPARKGWLIAGGKMLRVALGRAGIRAHKREGDGAHAGRPVSSGAAVVARRPPAAAAHHACQCAGSPLMTPGARTRRTGAITGRFGARPMNQATGCRAQDGLYDLIIEIDHNTRPRVAGLGSAVFIHVARPGFRPDRGLRRAAPARSFAGF